MTEQERIIRHFKGLIDSTLREGDQFSRANFTLEEQNKIFLYLSRIGVDYVEVGNPAQPKVREAIIELVRCRTDSQAKILCHIRNHAQDLQHALASRVNGVNILCTADPERIQAMRLIPREYLKRLESNILQAKSHGMEIRISVEDFFHQQSWFSRSVYDMADHLGVDRIGLVDTLGRTLSWDVFRRIRSLRQRYGMDIEGHFHNDLGHAVGNSLAALMAGANWIDTSLLGIGERTGITPLSSLLVNMYILDQKIAVKYNLKLLTEAENYISKICDIEMPINLSTNRGNGFAHKAGIHLDALIRFGPQKYESFSPQLIGNERCLVIGSPVSGKTKPGDVSSFEKRHGPKKQEG